MARFLQPGQAYNYVSAQDEQKINQNTKQALNAIPIIFALADSIAEAKASRIIIESTERIHKADHSLFTEQHFDEYTESDFRIIYKSTLIEMYWQSRRGLSERREIVYDMARHLTNIPSTLSAIGDQNDQRYDTYVQEIKEECFDGNSEGISNLISKMISYFINFVSCLVLPCDREAYMDLIRHKIDEIR